MAASPSKTQSPPKADAERTQRADARRNRERVLAVARAQFAAKGLDAQIDEIARAADVGVGTVYRHFPTKEALLEALAADRFTRLAEWAREALQAPDGWQGFCGFLRRSAELGANDRLLSEAMAERQAFQGAQREKDELMEATAAIAVMLPRFELSSPPPVAAAAPSLTLRPAGGMRLQINPRPGRASVP